MRFLALNKFYYDEKFKTIAQKPICLSQTERFVVPIIFTYFGRGMINYYVHALFKKLPNTHVNLSTMKVVKKTLNSFHFDDIDE